MLCEIVPELGKNLSTNPGSGWIHSEKCRTIAEKGFKQGFWPIRPAEHEISKNQPFSCWQLGGV